MIKKSYAIYDRSAVGLQRESSPSTQRIEQCKGIVSAVGGSLVGVFEDIGVSGSRGATASARDQFMERVKAGGIDYVVVPDLARLSRSAVTVMQITAEMKASGTELLIAHDLVRE